MWRSIARAAQTARPGQNARLSTSRLAPPATRNELVVGDVLVSEGRITDVYEKESKGKTMTFLVSETRYTDERTGEPVLTSRMNLIHRSA